MTLYLNQTALNVLTIVISFAFAYTKNYFKCLVLTK